MVGRRGHAVPEGRGAVGDVLLEVDGLTRGGAFADVSFAVRAGEIVGMAGLVGAGRTEVARVLFGIDRADAGAIRLDGKAVAFASPAAAMARRDRLRPGGPSPGRPRPRLLDRVERDPADPARLFPRLLVHRSAERAWRPRSPTSSGSG